MFIANKHIACGAKLQLFSEFMSIIDNFLQSIRPLTVPITEFEPGEFFILAHIKVHRPLM